MTEIKLELFDPTQAAEVRKFIQDQIPQARIVEGVQDLTGGTYNPDRHVTIDYHDEQLLDTVLNQFFAPQSKNWRDFQVS